MKKKHKLTYENEKKWHFKTLGDAFFIVYKRRLTSKDTKKHQITPKNIKKHQNLTKI
jgi:hypothetical protein